VRRRTARITSPLSPLRDRTPILYRVAGLSDAKRAMRTRVLTAPITRAGRIERLRRVL
jgi:hypothetical protein